LATTNLNPCLLLNGDKKEFFLSKTLKSNWNHWHCERLQVAIDLDESMSVLHFEKDNLLSHTKIWKTYILNTKHIRTNCEFSLKVWDDWFWKIDKFPIIIHDKLTTSSHDPLG
jgi:hypothetical protein